MGKNEIEGARWHQLETFDRVTSDGLEMAK
jgi:hypothetical protein